jgi:hypothetical protein
MGVGGRGPRLSSRAAAFCCMHGVPSVPAFKDFAAERLLQ